MLTTLIDTILSQVLAYGGTALEREAKALAERLLKPLIEGQPREITESDIRTAASAFNDLHLKQGGGI